MKTEKLLLGLIMSLFVLAANGQVKSVHSTFGNNPKTEINISWITADTTDTSTYVLYGETTAYGSKSYNQSERIILYDQSMDGSYHDFWDSSIVVLIHHIKLKGLTPGTKYHYKCGGDNWLSGDCTFQTAPEGNVPYTYAVIGDPQVDSVLTASWNVNLKDCANFLKDQNVSFVISLGDNVQGIGVGRILSQWGAFFESGKPIFENTIFLPIVGSHDMNSMSTVGQTCMRDYMSLFRLPNTAPTLANRCWAFEYSNSVFGAVDCYTGWRGEAVGYPVQKAWLENVYKNSIKPWKFLSIHEPPYTIGHAADYTTPYLPNFLAVADTYNIVSAFSGHSHGNYEFTHPILHVAKPPVVSNAVLNGNKATANLSQGTTYYTGVAVACGANGTVLPTANFTLNISNAGGQPLILLATVYNDSIVYKVTFYRNFGGRLKGDTYFTYKILNDTPGKKFSLNVSSAGNGSTNPTGSVQYNANENASISAIPNGGYLFDNWTGADVPVGKENDNPLVIKMDTNKTIVAHFKVAPVYALTVNSGTGSGSYAEGILVPIIANTPVTGKVFDKWTGDITNIANINASSTTITMPASIVSITATYKDAPPNTYTLTVISGTGSGNYTAATIVNISANAPATGKVFDKWTGDVTGIVNVNASSTTITMPSANATVTATYKDEFPSYTLTVNEGTGSGSYIAGNVVTITANAAPIDKIFNKWTGDVTGISNIYASTSTITMPSANVAITATFKDGTNAIAAEKSMVSIYPNPVTDVLNILSPFPIDEIKIVDLTGKILLIEKLAGNNSIALPVSQLEKGMYIIDIKLSAGNAIRKTFIVR